MKRLSTQLPNGAAILLRLARGMRPADIARELRLPYEQVENFVSLHRRHRRRRKP